jgi:hypothetical protein
MLNSQIQTRRPLARTLAVGVPWLAVVGLLAGAEYVRNEGTLTRGLLQLFSGSCSSQVAGLDLTECNERAAPGPDFPFLNEPEKFVFAPGKLQHMRVEPLPPLAKVQVISPVGPPAEQSQQALIALEAARAEMDHAMEAARLEVDNAMTVARSWRETQESRSSSSYLLRRPAAPRSDCESHAVNVRVSTDG